MCQIHGPLMFVYGVRIAYNFVKTDINEMAYRACINCMNEYLWQLDDLSYKYIEAVKSHSMECISSGDAHVEDKIRTLRHFIRRGWMNELNILEHIFHELSSKQLKWFLKKGCRISCTLEYWAITHNKIEEVRLVSQFQELTGPAACFLGLTEKTKVPKDLILMIVDYVN